MNKIQTTKPSQFEKLLKKQIKKLVVIPLTALIEKQTRSIIERNNLVIKQLERLESLIDIFARQKARELKETKKISR
jgi:hypothetical protein